MYKLIILSHNQRFSFPAASPALTLAGCWVGYVHTMNEPTGSNNRHLSRAIMTLYMDRGVYCIRKITAPMFFTSTKAQLTEKQELQEGKQS
jgi:hypothetical protein